MIELATLEASLVPKAAAALIARCAVQINALSADHPNPTQLNFSFCKLCPLLLRQFFSRCCLCLVYLETKLSNKML